MNAEELEMHLAVWQALTTDEKFQLVQIFLSFDSI